MEDHFTHTEIPVKVAVAKEERAHREPQWPCACIWETDRSLWGEGAMFTCHECAACSCPRGWDWFGFAMACVVDELLVQRFDIERTFEDPADVVFPE